MNRRILSLLVLVFLGLNFRASAQAVVCPPNIDFELGTTAYWNYYVGSCCTGSGSGSMTGWSSSAATTAWHTLMSGTGVDPYGFFPIVAPGGGSYSMRLGSTATGFRAARARYYVHVPTSTTAYSLIYKYACVLENPNGHGASIQPRFTVSAYDSATGSAIPCAQFNYVSSSSLPGFFLSPVTTTSQPVYCKSWTPASINLSGLAGRTVAIDFAAGDCGAGGHFGYGYLDLTCGLFAINTVGCDSISATLNAPPGFAQYRWSDSTTMGTIIDTLQTITISMPTVATTYAVVLLPYTGYGCPDTLYTHVVPSRLKINKMGDTTLCLSSTPSFVLRPGATDITALSYVWTPSSTLSCSTCANPVATPTASTTYVFTVTNGVGCSMTDSIRVRSSLVASTVSTRNVRCYGDRDGTASATAVSGIAPFTFSWNTSPPQTGANAVGIPFGSYTLTTTDSTGCSGTTAFTITQPAPTIVTLVSFSHPTTCGGNDGSITISGLRPGSTDTLSYEVTPYGGSTTTVNVVLTASSAGVVVINGLTGSSYPNYTTYDNIAVVTAGCQYNVLGPVQLRDPAPPPVPTDIDPGYCQYETPSVLTLTSGTSFNLWYSPGSSTPSTTAPTPSTSVPGRYVYYVTQTVANCVSPRDSIIVTVTPKPAAPTTVDTTYCQFATSVPLTAGGVNLKWYTAPSGGTALTSIPTPSTATPGTTTWYVSQTVLGCESDRTPLNVTTLYLPSFHIAESRNFLCQFDTLTLWYDGPALTSPDYTWTLPTGSSILTGSTTSSSIIVKFDSLFLQTAYLKVSNYNGRCFTIDTLNIKVVPQPTADAFIKENICIGDTVTIALTGRSSNADHFSWDFAGGNVITANSNSGGPYKLVWSTPGIHILKLTAVTSEGCVGKPLFDTIKIINLPDAGIITHTTARSICIEDSVYLTARDSSNYGAAFEWAPAHFFRNTNRPGLWGRIETPGYITLTVTNAYGCKASDSVLITPDACCKVTFPSAFTPNGDGLNDVFRPIANGYHRFHSFRIQNRWGQTVFESTNSKCEWDGTFNGVPQDLGVYYYFIKYDCDDNGLTGKKERMEKGDVTLIR